MHILKKRLFEMFTASIIISVITVALFLLGIIPGTEYNAAVTCIIGTALFIFFNVKQLQRCMVDLVRLKRYYKYNYLSYLIFAAVSTAICLFLPVEIFSIMFSFTKFIRYSYAAISYKKSLLIFHAIMLIVIGVTPFLIPEKYKRRILRKKAHRAQRKAKMEKDNSKPQNN